MTVQPVPHISSDESSAQGGGRLSGVAERIAYSAATHGGGLLSVSDIAAAAGVAKSTVRRQLASLIADGYLRYTSLPRYYAPGPRAHRFAVDQAA